VTVVVDGNNVMGAAADGWWRDRAGAARRLFDRLVAYRAATGEAVVLALDVPHPDLPAGDNQGVEVVYPTRSGRDAADDRIVALIASWARPHEPGDVTVVTSDRGLRSRLAPYGVGLTGAGTFLSRLRDLGV
jgi:predicted RNA-binding protein with PIN domain